MYENTFLVVRVLLIVAIYMLPTLIAYARDIPARQTITVLNIVAGWTLIGWIVCFIWALMAETQADELT